MKRITMLLTSPEEAEEVRGAFLRIRRQDMAALVTPCVYVTPGTVVAVDNDDYHKAVSRVDLMCRY